MTRESTCIKVGLHVATPAPLNQPVPFSISPCSFRTVAVFREACVRKSLCQIVADAAAGKIFY